MFDGPHPAAARCSAAWSAVFELARQYQQSGLLREDLIRSNLYRLLATTLLESFRLVGDRGALRASAERLGRIHRTAAAFFHDFASRPITTEDAAEAAGASVPELAAAFRGHDVTGSSPSTYLRSVRLAAAFTDLRRADPARGDTVAAIARRWGFPSPGRFAAAFRAAYGVNPKWVLDR